MKNSRSAFRRAVVVLLGVCLLAGLVFLPIPAEMHSQYVRATLDLSHFVIAAAACWYLCERRGWSALAAMAVIVCAVVGCEFLQSYTGRCPSAADAFRGVFGALAMLACLTAWRHCRSISEWIAAAGILVIVSYWPLSEFLVLATQVYDRVGAVIG